MIIFAASARRALFVLPLAFALTTLVACAPQNSERLPDDPSFEEFDPNISPEHGNVVDDGIEMLPAPLANYDHVDKKGLIPKNLLKKALAYYDANLSKIKNKAVLSVIDFAQPSNKPRFFIIDMKSGSVWALRTSHGKGSDANHDGFAEKFSNTSGSNASSLGVYMTAETYNGGNGYSLRLDGLSSTNSNARARAVVVHGASYVQDRDVIQGRSFGCPAVPMDVRKKVIDTIKGGSIIYAQKSF
ncbi:MAG: murein L,D-transpeptidase catalytic domain family protein [Bdellovibrionota bacterium]